MSDKPHALSTLPPASPAEPDYDSICGAVMATPRGRWFLNEYARRNRNSDTSQVLAAIERMEAAITGERVQQTNQDVRIELLEMARAIAQTRADVAETRADSPPLRAGAQSNAGAPPDIAGAAERLRDIAWTMRACGVELATSEQIEQLAETILSASSLHAGGGDRTRKLGEVLHYLEHRIDRMLDSHMDKASAGTSRTVPEDFPAPPQEPPAPNGHDRDAGVAAMEAAHEAPHAEDSASAATLLAVSVPEIAAIDAAAFEAVVSAEQATLAEAAVTFESDRVDAAPVQVASAPDDDADPDAAFPAGDDAQSKVAQLESAAEFTSFSSDVADERPATFDVVELRVEQTELELEPLVVVPVGIAGRNEGAPPSPQSKVHSIASVVTAASPGEAPASTGDPALDVAFALPEASAAAAPEQDVEGEAETTFAGLDIEPLAVVPVGPVEGSAVPPPSVELEVGTPHPVDVPDPMAASHPTVEHALDQELALPVLAAAMQPEVQVVLIGTVFAGREEHAAWEAVPTSVIAPAPDAIGPAVAQPLESVFPDAPPVPNYNADAIETAALGPEAVALEPETIAITTSEMTPDSAPDVEAAPPTAGIVFEPEPVNATSPEFAESLRTAHIVSPPDVDGPAFEPIVFVPAAPEPQVPRALESDAKHLLDGATPPESETAASLETEAAPSPEPDVASAPAPEDAEATDAGPAPQPAAVPAAISDIEPARELGAPALPALDLPATTETAPVAAAEPAPLVATGEADSVAMQVDEDLFALMEIPADAASETAGDVVAPPAEQTPASVAASAPEPPPATRPESDVLSSAWETAVQSPPAFPERPSDRRPVPSMWEHPSSARLAREDAAADFLHEQAAPSDTPIQPAAAASAPFAAGLQVEIEDDLFADQPSVADPVPAPVAAAAISEAAPPPPAAAALPEPSGPSEAQPPSAVMAAPAPALARPAVKPMPRHTADDPLAALTAMTDEERIALFT